jgi:hypothetical protein
MATQHLVRTFVPRLFEAAESAQLLVSGSMAAVPARAGISPYVAAKHAFTRRDDRTGQLHAPQLVVPAAAWARS